MKWALNLLKQQKKPAKLHAWLAFLFSSHSRLHQAIRAECRQSLEGARAPCE